MSNATATDYMAAVRDMANDLTGLLGDHLKLSTEDQNVLNGSLRMFAHAILDTARVEAARDRTPA